MVRPGFGLVGGRARDQTENGRGLRADDPLPFPLFGLYMLLECAVTASFFFVIRFVNPSIVSFFDILSPLFVTIIAFFYLKEKLKKIEILGGIVSLCGVAVLTYVSPEVKLKFLLMIVMQVLFYSTSSILAKKKIQAIPPLVITCFRVFVLFAVASLQLLWKGEAGCLPDANSCSWPPVRPPGRPWEPFASFRP